MSDERYERSADMRLLELQRAALGIPRRIIKTTTYSDPEPLTDAARDEDLPFVSSGAIVVASIDAQPRTSIIAGALVTVSLAAANDGDVAARGVRLSLPLPAATSLRPGTFRIDGAAADDVRCGELFAAGIQLGDLDPGARRTLVLKLVVEAGVGAVTLTPHVSAAFGAVLGLRAIRLTRGAAARPDAIAERPFYESDPAEIAAEPWEPAQALISIVQPRELPPAFAPPASLQAITAPAPDDTRVLDVPRVLDSAPLSQLPPHPPENAENPALVGADLPAAPSVAPPRIPMRAAASAPPASPPAATREVKPKAKPRPNPKAKVKPKPQPPAEAPRPAPIALAPKTKVAVVRSIEDAIAVGGSGGPVLTVPVDRKRLATLSGLFGGPSLGMIAHYLVLNALAVKDALPGDGDAGAIAQFVTNQESLLSRALIATRLGKLPSADSLGAVLPAFPSDLTLHKRRRTVGLPALGQSLLVRSFAPAETAFLRRTLANESTSPFLRAAQLFVGLCANDAIIADERARHQVAVALTAYAALATAEISRIFLRAKLSRDPDIFKATEAAFDDAARTVLAALGRAME